MWGCQTSLVYRWCLCSWWHTCTCTKTLVGPPNATWTRIWVPSQCSKDLVDSERRDSPTGWNRTWGIRSVYHQESKQYLRVATGSQQFREAYNVCPTENCKVAPGSRSLVKNCGNPTSCCICCLHPQSGCLVELSVSNCSRHRGSLPTVGR